MDKSPESLKQIDQRISELERTLQWLLEQRREIINYLDLNKEKSNESI